MLTGSFSRGDNVKRAYFAEASLAGQNVKRKNFSIRCDLQLTGDREMLNVDL